MIHVDDIGVLATKEHYISSGYHTVARIQASREMEMVSSCAIRDTIERLSLPSQNK